MSTRLNSFAYINTGFIFDFVGILSLRGSSALFFCICNEFYLSYYRTTAIAVFPFVLLHLSTRNKLKASFSIVF